MSKGWILGCMLIIGLFLSACETETPPPNAGNFTFGCSNCTDWVTRQGYWNECLDSDKCGYFNSCADVIGEGCLSGYVPYNGATANVNLGSHGISTNGTIFFGEKTGTYDLISVNPGDGFKMSYWYNFEAVNDDWLVFNKVDGNDASPDGGIAFMMTNGSGYNRTVIKIDGYGTANFTDYNIKTTGNITTDKLTFKDENGQERHLSNIAIHLGEMQMDTLLDKSRSSITVQGVGKLNYTLYAYYGVGQWNFNGTIYPNDNIGVSEASVILLNGTDLNPKINYIHFYISGGVPTLAATQTYPSYTHIDVATFVVGAVGATSATVYAYNRNRYEIDSFVKRVLQRFEKSGTLYTGGFTTKASTTTLNISTGSFINNIFEMTTTNNVSIATGFYYINSSGQFVQATSLAALTQYNNGVRFSGVNERVKIVWGVVPINTTGGVGPTQVRLVAVLPNYPGAGNTYQSVGAAIQDTYSSISYYPPNDVVKAVFTPIAKTILRPNADVLEPYATGIYYKFIAGTVGTGGVSPTSATTDHAVLTNLEYKYSGHTGFVPSIGATENVNLSNYNISANSVIISASLCDGNCKIGTIGWNATYICVCTDTNVWKVAKLS